MADDGDFRDMRTGDERVFVEHHMKAEPGSPPALLHPAKSLFFGRIEIGANKHPHITIYAACSAFGLCFVPTVEELEQAAKAMLDQAALMRKEADDQLAELLKRGRG